MDIALVDLRVAEDLLDGLERAAEEILAELFEARTSTCKSIYTEANRATLDRQKAYLFIRLVLRAVHWHSARIREFLALS